MNGIEITADDWGLAPEINDAIVDLTQLGLIRRVSVLIDGQFADYRLTALRQFENVQLGLHYNLTYRPGEPDNWARLVELWTKWTFASPRRRSELLDEARLALSRQIEGMRAHGIPPQFLDSHHHVLLLPRLAEHIADLARAQGLLRVRLPYDPALFRTLRFPIPLLASYRRATWHKLGFESKGVVYVQDKDLRDESALLRRILRCPTAEVIVHPATEAYGQLGELRVRQYKALRKLALEMGISKTRLNRDRPEFSALS